MQSITFTGENVPLLTYPGRGTFYSFGVETEGLVQLEGAAAENEDAYVFLTNEDAVKRPRFLFLFVQYI